MPKRLTNDYVKSEINKEELLISDYVNAHTPITIQCHICKENYQKRFIRYVSGERHKECNKIIKPVVYLKDIVKNCVACNKEFSNRRVNQITCTICGKINIVNANKKINCNECHETVDRDMNGARNIFLKHVGTGVLTSEVQSVF
jgi:transposase